MAPSPARQRKSPPERPLEPEEQGAGAEGADVDLRAGLVAMKASGGERGLEIGPVALRPDGERAAHGEHRRDGLPHRQLGDDRVVEQIRRADGAEARVILGLGAERGRRPGEEQREQEDRSWHRWKMGAGRQAVNAHARALA